jgi:hypothetical protein
MLWAAERLIVIATNLYSLRYQVFTEEMKKLDCLKGASGNV